MANWPLPVILQSDICGRGVTFSAGLRFGGRPNTGLLVDNCSVIKDEFNCKFTVWYDSFNLNWGRSDRNCVSTFWNYRRRVGGGGRVRIRCKSHLGQVEAG